MQKHYNIDEFSLVLPALSHEKEYCRVIDRWESYDEKIQPPSMRRYSQKDNFSFSKWLANCKDDRTTGSMLANNIPCTLYYLVNSSNEILGGIDINHANTLRGQLHAGIVPWHRGKGFRTAMLGLASYKCKDMGLVSIEIAPRKENYGAIQTIIRNCGVLMEEFFDDEIACQRYKINL